MIDMDDANDVNSNDTHDINDELHIAVALNHIEETKSLLAQDYNLVNQIDLNGNQPLHIAAQTGCDIEIVKTLIQYDAPIGRRNYEGLTPLGEARFHGKKEIVRLLKRYYRIIGDCKSIDTSIDTTCLGTSIEREEPEKYKYSRIDLESIPSQTLIRKIEQEERMQKAQLDWLDWWKRKKEHESAMLIQEIIRQYLAKKHAQKLEFERINAIQIQQTWRKYRYKKQQKAATKIQSFQRMVVVKTYFTSFQYERLFWHRASRILAIFAQRLWRGHKGRSQARRLREMSNLPDPSDTSLPYSYDEWVQHQTEAHPPSRTWNMYSEFVLSGKPRTWQERRIKRNGLFYRDVVFWVNNLTQQTSWTQPQKWKILDQQEYIMRLQVIKIGYTLAQHQTACKLQVLWRARVAKRNLSLILRSQRVIKKAIDVYYCDPENIVALCNYTLYIHVVQENIEHAMSLYEHCLTRMKQKGNDNAFILYGFAIFRARTDQDYATFASRAKSVEARYQKRNETKQSLYLLANEIFRYAAIEKQTGSSWHNYALCRMIAFRDFLGAKASFIKAMKLCSQDRIILKNFNRLLSDNGQDEDAFDEFRKAQLE